MTDDGKITNFSWLVDFHNAFDLIFKTMTLLCAEIRKCQCDC